MNPSTSEPRPGCTPTAGSPSFVLFLTFLILKLTHVIDWSWWWITAPLWIAIVLGAIVAFLEAFVESNRR